MLDNGEPVGCRPRRADIVSHLISWNSYLNPEAYCLTVVILPVFASAFKRKTKQNKTTVEDKGLFHFYS